MNRLIFLLSSLASATQAFIPHRQRLTVISTTKLFTKSDEPNQVVDNKRKDEILSEASDALNSVGWSPPSSVDGELTSDDPFVLQISESIKRDVGVDLDDLLNPATVVNLERDLYNLRIELALASGKGDDFNIAGLTTEECDGGLLNEECEALRADIAKKEKKLAVERRSVFRGWLKNVFLIQAVLSLGLSWVMVSDPGQLFGGFDWFSNTYNMDTSIKVLGFWWWWLFIVPSLRSRRPSGAEKKALDLAFIGTPAVSLLAPVATKDTVVIWILNFLVTSGSYAYAYFLDNGDNSLEDDDSNSPEWLKFVKKSLDFGSGRERGARK